MSRSFAVVVFCFLSLAVAGCWPAVSEAQEDKFEDLISGFLNTALDQRPNNNENGISEHFKNRALNDRSNFDIYDSTSQEIIERSGYKQKSYQVVSNDGYITQIINIINPLADRSRLKGPPVMLFHGGIIDTTSWIWVDSIQHHPERYPRDLREHGPIRSSNRSLAFMLANNGFDVWLVGTRGSNKQNMSHIKYQARLLEDLLGGLSDIQSTVRQLNDTIEYFDYSMDELVEHEYPRQIETVLKLTRSKRVSVVGLSYSTPILFKILASNKSLAGKIHSYLALEAMLNTNGASLLLKLLYQIVPFVPRPFGTLLLEVGFSKTLRDTVLRRISRYGLFKTIMSLLVGSSSKYSTDLCEPVVGHIGLSTGFKEIQHSAQQMKLGQLQKFDYGPTKNQLVYGSSTPFVYDLSQIDLKHWMIVSSANDVLGTPDSADEYVRQIRIRPYKSLRIQAYSHLDGVAAFDNDIKVNLPALEFFEKFHIAPARNTIKSGMKQHSRV